MSLYRRDRMWHYDFWHRGNRYRGSTGQTSRTRAKRVEALLLFQVREKRGFIHTNRIPILSELAPKFLDWVKASTLEPATKRYYPYGWRMLQKTEIVGMRLDHISTDAAEVSALPRIGRKRQRGAADSSEDAAQGNRTEHSAVLPPDQAFERAWPGYAH